MPFSTLFSSPYFRGHKSFIVFDRRPSPLGVERIMKSLTIPPSQCDFSDSNLWLGFDTTCRTVCLTNPSNDQLVKDEGAQIFYSIRSQTKPIGIGANCEIPHNLHFRAVRLALTISICLVGRLEKLEDRKLVRIETI